MQYYIILGILIAKIKQKRGVIMNSFIKGMTTGLAVGATCAAVLMPKSAKSKRAMKSNAGRALRAVGNMIDNFQSMID